MYLYEDESQYFGFFPLNFVDSLAESSYDLVYTVMDRFITVVLSSEESGLVSSHQLEEGLGKLITLLEYAMDKNFDLLETYSMKNVFRFPPKIYRTTADEKLTPEESERVEAEWVSKRKAWKASKLLNIRLRHYKKRLLHLNEAYKRILLEFGKIQSVLSGRNQLTNDLILHVSGQLDTLKESCRSTSESLRILSVTSAFSSPSSTEASAIDVFSANDELAQMHKIVTMDTLKSIKSLMSI